MVNGAFCEVNDEKFDEQFVVFGDDHVAGSRADRACLGTEA